MQARSPCAASQVFLVFAVTFAALPVWDGEGSNTSAPQLQQGFAQKPSEG